MVKPSRESFATSSTVQTKAYTRHSILVSEEVIPEMVFHFSCPLQLELAWFYFSGVDDALGCLGGYQQVVNVYRYVFVVVTRISHPYVLLGFGR